MKSLIYLHLNFKLNRYACQNGKSSFVNDIYLDFQDLSKREKSLSYLTLHFYSLITNLQPYLPKLKIMRK